MPPMPQFARAVARARDRRALRVRVPQNGATGSGSSGSWVLVPAGPTFPEPELWRSRFRLGGPRARFPKFRPRLLRFLKSRPRDSGS
eukprot:558510-Alexandrium_andersonii.AAC.1